jgi:tetratricopeptide (TPR) repeat protein
VPKTILLGLDGLDWRLLRPLIVRGELPAFKFLVGHGVTGNLHTLEPTLSPLLWNSIATGKRAAKHGIHGFTEVDPQTGLVRPVSSLSRSCKAVWNILQQNGARCHLLNWFASHPAEPLSGSAVSDLFAEGAPPLDRPWPLRRGLVHPDRLGPVLAGLRMSPDELDGDLLGLFVPRGAEVDQAKDKRLFVLARELAKALSVHHAATWLLQHEPVDFLAAYWRTPDLLFHTFMPCHPPAIDGVDPLAAEIYADVVNSVCRLHDRFLGTYLRLAGPDAHVIVVSDHGFQSGAQRPAFNENPFANPEAWHRPQGVFLAQGPRLKTGAEIHGASLLDVTPTILTLHGLPAARDMDGRVLAEAFKDEPEPDHIASWEAVPGDTGQHPPGTAFDALDSAALIRQFVDLGYLESPDEDQAKAAAQTREGNQWNLARDLLDSGQPGVALPLLEVLHRAHPQNPGFAQALAGAQKQVGLAAEAGETLARLFERLQPGPPLLLLRAELALENQDYAGALSLLQELAGLDPKHSGLHLRLGRTYAGLNRHAEAQREFEAVLQGDPENAHACQGLAHVLLRQRFWDLAAATALKALGLQHNLPLAHFYFALAVERLGHRAVATDALRTAISYAPGFVGARRMLMRLLARDAGNEAEIATQRQALAALRQHHARSAARVENIRALARGRAAARALGPPSAPTVARNDGAGDEGEGRRTRVGDPGYRAMAIRTGVGDPGYRAVPTLGGDVTGPERPGTVALPGAEEAPPPAAPGEFVLVSGLPRSGTSLMMQMLHAAGVPLQVDGVRAADPDNPEGYFEWEAIKTLPKNPRILDAARGRALKVISLLLPALPRQHHYKIIFMQRPVGEVAASQLQMLRRRFPGKTHASRAKMAGALRTHRDEILALLRGGQGIELLEVSYPGLVRDPGAWLPRLAAFLAPRWPFAMEPAAAAVKPGLHRQRGGG